MIIEIQEPAGGIAPELLNYVKEKIMEFYHLNKGILRADINFHETPGEGTVNKACEVRLTVFGDSLFAQRITDSYDQSAIRAIQVIRKEVLGQVKENLEPPDIVVSSVKP